MWGVSTGFSLERNSSEGKDMGDSHRYAKQGSDKD